MTFAPRKVPSLWKWTFFFSLPLGLTGTLPSVHAEDTGSAPTSEGSPRSIHFWSHLDLGPAWQSMNDFQIPTTTGTRLALTDWGSGPALGARLYLGARFLERHEARLLLAPLSLTLSGKLPDETRFHEKTFAAGKTTQALYQFNSYRLTYRYVLLDGPTWKFRLGFTGKIRVAEIRLTQGSKSSGRTDLGFVPLLHLNTEWNFAPNWKLALDADALWSPYGRAEDVSLLTHYQWTDWLSIHGGYRTVEGGSDGGGKVYTFAWLHFLVTGVGVHF